MDKISQNERDATAFDITQLLRKGGCEQKISLPQIVVCGDQSSGKSSVLEAISGGIPFPTSDGVCTRFPVEIVLRYHRSEDLTVSASIIPDPKRPVAERAMLDGFQMQNGPVTDLKAIFEAAGAAIIPDKQKKRFSNDVLRVELGGPEMRNLTVVDLPGIFHSSNEHQTVDDIEFVKNMVKHYMQEPRTLILAVVHTKTNPVNQQVLQMAKDVDPDFFRTLTIVTKPDMLKVEEEPETFKDFQNMTTAAGLGVHFVKNPSRSEKVLNKGKRDQVERQFFSTADGWRDLPPAMKGIEALDGRITTLSHSLLRGSSAGLQKEVEAYASTLREQLKGQESGTTSPGEVKSTLFGATITFASYMAQIFDGQVGMNDSHDLHLKTNIETCVNEFAAALRSDDPHSADILVSESDTGGNNISPCRNMEIHVEKAIRSKPNVPGYLNMSMVTDLFNKNSESWTNQLKRLTDSVVRQVHRCVDLVAQHIFKGHDETMDGVRLHLLAPAIRALESTLISQVAASVDGHANRTILALNPDFYNAVRSARADAVREIVSRGLEQAQARGSSSTSGGTSRVLDYNNNLLQLVHEFAFDTEACTAKETVAYEKAHYQSEMQRLLNTFSAYEITKQVRHHLRNTFTAQQVNGLNDEQLIHMAGAGPEQSEEYKILEKQLGCVEQALQLLSTTELDSANVPQPRSSTLRTFRSER